MQFLLNRSVSVQRINFRKGIVKNVKGQFHEFCLLLEKTNICAIIK